MREKESLDTNGDNMLLTELVDWFPENHCCWTTLIGKYLSIFGKTMRKHGQPILWILLLGNICLYLEKHCANIDNLYFGYFLINIDH